MTKGKDLLTAVAVKGARPGAALRDGGGLFYRCSSDGTGRWVFRYKLTGQKQREQGLGAYPAVSLALARRKAALSRELVALGTDPIHQQELDTAAGPAAATAKANAWTLGRYADEVFLPALLCGFRNPAHIQQWQATFRTHFAALRDKPLSDVTKRDVLDVLKPLWAATYVTASRSRERLERLFSHAAQNHAFDGENPALWRHFDHTLIKPRTMTKGHHASIPHAQIAGFIAALRAKQPGSVAALMLEFIALAACRTGEARFGVWGEIDPVRGIWAIPAARMKMRRAHIVPLTPRMIDILGTVKALRDTAPAPTDYIFPGPKADKPLSEMAGLMLMRRMEAFSDYTAHGLRASFKGWAMTETDFARELIEEQLAHQMGAVEAAYYRTSAIERRRTVMLAWEAYLDGRGPAGAQVLPFRTHAAGADA
jgi:integrase